MSRLSQERRLLRAAGTLRLFLPGALLLLGTCLAQSSPRQEPGESPELLRGHVATDGVRGTFLPCGEVEPIPLEDGSGRLGRLQEELGLGGDSGRKLFAAAEGRLLRADSSQVFRVERILYAGLEGPGCDLDWNGFRFRASGNEPFWMAEVAEGGIRLVRPGLPELNWRQVESLALETGRRFFAPGGDGRPSLELILIRQECRDSMSGFFYGASALLRLGKLELHGCALEGEPPSFPEEVCR